jgi:hypothetical protein
MNENNALIEVKLVPTNFHTRWPCTICGGCTEKVSVLAEGLVAHDAALPDAYPVNPIARILCHHRPNGRTIRVCESCLEAGNIDQRLAEHARLLEAEARDMRALIGRLRVPSYEQWQSANRFFDGAPFAIFVQQEQAGDPITSREQLITHLEANDASNLIDLAGQYLDAWCTEWKAEWQAECEARQREPITWGDPPF